VLGERLVNGISDDIDADRNEAMDLADRAFLQAPADPFVLKMCGSIWAYVGDFEKSVDLLRHAVRVSPHDLGAWGYLGWPLVETGDGSDLEEVHRIMERILGAAPEHPGACFWHYHRSVAFACQGENAQAAEFARSALDLNRMFPWGWMHYANVLGLTGSAEEAKQAMVTCIKISPTLTPSHYDAMVRGMSATDDIADARIAGLRIAGLLV
jgi:predicted Zn-dependent protease